MDWHPFTKEEAIDVCDDFEDLIGTKFHSDELGLLKIDNVAVGPFSEEDSKLFADNYIRTRDISEALGFYEGNDFDIFVFAYPVDDKEEICYIKIRLFVEANGVNYKFP